MYGATSSHTHSHHLRTRASEPLLTMANGLEPDHGALPLAASHQGSACFRLLSSNPQTWAWAQLGSNQRPLACKDCHHHSPAPGYSPSTQVSASGDEHKRAQARTGEPNALPFALPSADQRRRLWPLALQRTFGPRPGNDCPTPAAENQTF
jgi:hypothetical protein